MSKLDLPHVATLARLALDSQEKASLEASVQKILSHFEDLSKVDTSQVKPLYHFTEAMPLREDLAEPALSSEDLFKNAPSSVSHCFKIPKFVGEQ